MRCFVMETDRYHAEAMKHSVTQVIKRFKNEVESIGDYFHNSRNSYSFGSYVKKKHGNFRTILAFKKLTVENQTVGCYVALRMMARGDSAYEVFCNRHISDEERDRITGMAAVDWDGYIQQITERLRSHEEIREAEPISDVETQYIQRDGGITQEIFDTPVIESKFWIEKICNHNFSDFYKVAQTLGRVIEDKTYNEDSYGLFEEPYGDRGMRILCARVDCKGKDQWYLLNIGNADEIKQFRKDQELDGRVDIETLKRLSRRAYPYSMLEGDIDFWKEMEVDQNSNFILSDEELKIVSERIDFPLFLTGRAGSGKSTMLQYLFAEYFLRYLEFNGVNPPAYISYSSNLIDNAKKLANNLFNKNHAYTKKLKNLGKDFVVDIQPKFDGVFHVFQNLVRKCIDESAPGILQKRFNMVRHVTYAKYREMWNKKFRQNPDAADKFGPALSWHVIRTYIKGWDAEEYLAPDSYKDIGKSNKSVSDEVFREVYENVWDKWYQKEQQEYGYWDDQDLVRYCLAPDDDSCETCVTEKFSAIFCDEAQDFTRTEIEFIIRLSTFSRRKIYDENTFRQLPFIFAGDEFQTLNPTGFSWDSLRSYFTERLTRTSTLENIGAPDPVVLTHNYRSPSPITKLANRLQLLRHTRCGIEGKFTPQIPYYTMERTEPVLCLQPDNPLIWKKLCSMGVVLIIPCSEGQTPREFIEKSSIRHLIEFYDDGSAKNITIYNPTQAKGLEYPNVAIYGFEGIKELSLQDLGNWYNSPSPEAESESRELEIKYFLSNAYVSITRARNRLFILSDFSENSFWAFTFSAEDPKLQSKITDVGRLMQSKVKSENEKYLGYLHRGDIDSLSGESFTNFGDVAISTKERAMELMDAGLMRQAAARFREQNNEDEIVTCEAYAYRFDSDHFNAALNFEKIGDYNNACEDYWNSFREKSPQEIISHICALKGKVNDFRIGYAEHYTKNKLPLNDYKHDLFNLAEKLEKGSQVIVDSIAETSSFWSTVLNAILNKVTMPNSSQKNEVSIILKYAATLDNYEIKLNKTRLAMMAYESELLADAVKIWSCVQVKDLPKEYYLAQCHLLKYPANLIYRENTGDPQWKNHIAEDYRSHPDVAVDNRQRKIIDQALIECGERQEVVSSLTHLWAASNDAREAKNYAVAAKKNNFCYAEDCVEGLFVLRWGNPANLSIERGVYASAELNDLLEVLIKIKQIRGKEFLEHVNKSLETINAQSRDREQSSSYSSVYSSESDAGKQKMSGKGTYDFWTEELGRYSRVKWNGLLFTEVGSILEKRGYFMDCLRYYEWAQRRTDDPWQKNELAVRWIVCKERIATLVDNPEIRNEILAGAKEKRREVGIDADYIIPVEFKFTRWDWIYENVLSLSPEKQSKSERQGRFTRKRTAYSASKSEEKLHDITDAPEKSDKEKKRYRSTVYDGENRSKVTESFKKTVITAIDKRMNNGKIQQSETINSVTKETNTISTVQEKKMINEVVIRGYKFRFNAVKGELSVSYESDTDDLHMKIKEGIIPDDGDFALQNGQLIKSESGENTGFKYELDGRTIVVIDSKSGSQHKFKLP